VLIPDLPKLALASYHGQCLTDGDSGRTFVLGIFADPIHDQYIGAYVVGDRIGVSEILLAKASAKERVTDCLQCSSWFGPKSVTNGDRPGLVDVNSSSPLVS